MARPRRRHESLVATDGGNKAKGRRHKGRRGAAQ
jgi:hypothetical protein